ncbi:HrpE/YscL family type III secretion apparatus protein [Desulfovibrio sp. OttesenSCG-928-F20]|nr:HrpE/YscL family type III secretion apparatus protein [Desulfovibrio sp. OttesenSCG-928-F20]
MGTLLFIKNGGVACPPGRSLLKAADYAKLVEAESILDLAREEAKAMSLAAQEAFAAEKERGYADGLAQGKAEMVERMMESLSAGVDYLEKLEGSLVDLVLNSMRKIIDGFDDKELVFGVVRKALSYARSQRRVVLRLCPDEAELVQEELAALQRDFPGIGLLDVVGDPRLTKGSCLLESELGIIDAGLDVQLAGIKKAFTQQLLHKGGER